MSSPLDVRNRRREAQRTVRLALNAIYSSLDAWKASIQLGKSHATHLTNSLLSLEHVPALSLGCLNDIPDLRQEIARKCISQSTSHLKALQLTFRDLEQSHEDLCKAIETIKQLLHTEEQDTILGLDTPVFTSLSISSITMLLLKIESMYTNELKVKRIVVCDFERCHAESIELRNDTKRTTSSIITKMHVDRHAQLESFLRVHITAWMVCVEISQQNVDEDLTYIFNDAKSC